MKVSGKTLTYFLLCGKFLLGILLIWLFYHQLQAGNLRSLNDLHRNDTFYVFLGLAIVFMPLNWILEAIKWKFMLPESISISWQSGLIQVFKGISLGIITPGRLGDYGGRLIHLEKSYHIQAIAATFAGSIAQNIIQFLSGAVCIYLFMDQLKLWNVDFFFTWTILTTLVFSVLGVLFFYPKRIMEWISRLEWLKKSDWVQKMQLSVHFSSGKLFLLLGLAFLRYLIYTGQYILIMLAFDMEMNLSHMILAVGVIYFFQSLLPLPPLLNWLGRGEIAVLILGQFQITAIYAMVCTYLLWFINLGLPAILGYILILGDGRNLQNEEIKSDGQILE